MLLITGGCGFIGSHVVRHFVKEGYQVINFDALTYAGSLANVADLESEAGYRFVQGDVADFDKLHGLFQEHPIEGVIHLAAESHVDRSIENPLAFVQTNTLGTAALLQAALVSWTSFESKRFLHVSTDEVFGSLPAEGEFTLSSPYQPRSPYSASKAGADHLVRSYFHTYGLPVLVSNCSNNYGPYQYPEKLIPVVIDKIVKGEKIPVYGDGKNVRDWLHVQDHVAALASIFERGEPGQTYLVGGDCEVPNIELVQRLCRLCDQELGRAEGQAEALISFVKDRAGHDFRYAIDASRIRDELGWEPQVEIGAGLRQTVRWYLDHQDWCQEVRSG